MASFHWCKIEGFCSGRKVQIFRTDWDFHRPTARLTRTGALLTKLELASASCDRWYFLCVLVYPILSLQRSFGTSQTLCCVPVKSESLAAPLARVCYMVGCTGGRRCFYSEAATQGWRVVSFPANSIALFILLDMAHRLDVSVVFTYSQCYTLLSSSLS